MELHLSKSKYCNAVQCPKMLWMQTNRPELFDDSVMNQAVLDNGSEVGDLAMGLFGEYVEVPFDKDLGKMIQKTAELLEAGTPTVCEASAAFSNMQYMPPDQLKTTRHNLLKYCELDTYAMVKVWEKLKEVVE